MTGGIDRRRDRGPDLPGALPEGDGTRFRVWAPQRRRVDVVVNGGRAESTHRLERHDDGYHVGLVHGVGPGARYRYRLDGDGPFPDPASRFQPDGVHGPSEVIDPTTFAWNDGAWRGRPLRELTIYELHVGVFTPAGTFAAATARLQYLRDLGIGAVELMPVADFAGRWNWGYDGVALYAPSRAYGRPDDLRRLVDRAHRLDLSVLLDVVYNHLGPDGSYLRRFSPEYVSTRHSTPWGDALNFDGDGSAPVRAFVTENAAYWVREFHVDGLRLDATHAIVDDSPRHILADVGTAARAAAPGREVTVIAEDNRNFDRLIRPASAGGYALDGEWTDDFHHILRRMLAGDSEGYFADFSGTVDELVTAVRDGWFYRGQFAPHFGSKRGTDPAGIPPQRFVIALQTHDQVGNRAFGGRLHHAIDAAAWRAASTLLLLAPETPLLFMGQEWGATAPFLFFTDHHSQLGRQVTEGRRKEFRTFSAFADPASQRKIPDPQAEETFRRSQLDWNEPADGSHAALLRLYRDLLALRRDTLAAFAESTVEVQALGPDSIVVIRRTGAATQFVVVRLRGQGPLSVPSTPGTTGGWQLRVDTEHYAPDPMPAIIGPRGAITFRRPGAVVLEAA
jgi:maltooligosyltrehalose trehalohydrolase